MTQVQHSILINQPIEKVYAFVSDPRNDPQWQTGIIESTVVGDAPIAVGTQIKGARTFMGRKLEAVLEVVNLQPNQRFSLKSVKAPFPFTATYTFSSEGGATRIDAILDLEAAGFFKLAEGMLSSSANKEMEQSLATLKSKLES